MRWKLYPPAERMALRPRRRVKVADHGLDSGAAAQFAFDDAEHGALLAGDEDAAWILGIVSTVPLTWGVSDQVVLFSCA